MKFICDVSNPIFAEWAEKKKALDAECDAEIEFMRRRADAMDEKRRKSWQEAWDKLQAGGLIEAGLDREKYGMSVSEDFQQFFISPKEDHPLEGFLKSLRGKL